MDVGGGSNACHVVFVSSDSVAAVTAFYQRELNTGNWQVTSTAPARSAFGSRMGK